MSTTDPTPLAEQIAREHRATLNTSTWLIVGCSCDPALTAPANGVAGSWYAAHIATVTERAVREQAAADIEAARTQADEFIQGDRRRRAKSRGHATFNAGMTRAARIARGATDG